MSERRDYSAGEVTFENAGEKDDALRFTEACYCPQGAGPADETRDPRNKMVRVTGGMDRKER
jgi:hypothetical protein